MAIAGLADRVPLLSVRVIAASCIKAAAYLCYVAWHFRFPFETHWLEATMVHHAWRVMNGSAWYPAWTSYPHVTNFFTPLYFWIVGSVGRAAGASIPDLFVIGRSVTFLSTLCGTACLAWYLWKRHGQSAALVGTLLSLGAAPLYGFSIMTRPDAMADAAGLAGLLLTTVRGRTTTIAAGALLAIAILTKQTAGIYLAAALVMCLGNGMFAQAGLIAATSGLALAGVSVVLTTSSAPLFLVSIFQERLSPFLLTGWMTVMAQLARLSPELLVLPVAGIALWIWQKNYGLALATGTLFAGSLLTALKAGADMNYFLPLRTASVLAAGSLWAVARNRPYRRQGLSTAAAAAALLVLLPGSTHAVTAAREARALRAFVGSPPGALLLETYDELIRLVQTPDLRVLTDSGILALYQKDRAPFVDPWLFRLLVTTERVHPVQMEHWLESEAYDVLVLTGDLHSSVYGSNSMALPPSLVERARAHYQQVGQTAGLFIYRPRPRHERACPHPGSADEQKEHNPQRRHGITAAAVNRGGR